MSEASPLKAYLGDGVYADFNGFAIVLTTENGVAVQNTITLEPKVLCELDRYLARIRAECADRRRVFESRKSQGAAIVAARRRDAFPKTTNQQATNAHEPHP